MIYTDVMREYIHHTQMLCFFTRVNDNFIVSSNTHIRIIIFGM